MNDFFEYQSIPSSIYERYQRCSRLDVIQHIDIHGKYRSSFNERTYVNFRNIYSHSSQPSSTISKAYLSPSTSLDGVESKFSTFSIKTKVSDITPGTKLWSKMRKKSRINMKNVFTSFLKYQGEFGVNSGSDSSE